VNDAVKDLYQKVIVEHGKRPKNHGALAGATHEATLQNPLCGDEVTVRVILVDGRLDEIRFESRGCVLSRASASLMTERVRGGLQSDALALGRELESYLSAPPADADDASARLGDPAVFEGVRDYPSRISCVVLPWQALARACHLRPTGSTGSTGPAD
jgi:nitrogen fixation protein NifU and related proteins